LLHELPEALFILRCVLCFRLFLKVKQNVLKLPSKHNRV